MFIVPRSFCSVNPANIPQTAATGINISDLPTEERNILLLVARSLLRAVCPAYRYAETVVTVDCGGTSFTAKGKEVLDLGWRAFAENKADTVLPDSLTEGAALAADAVRVKTGQMAPPKSYTEDTILKSMETAGVEDMPDDVERKGIGTPATRAAVLRVDSELHTELLGELGLRKRCNRCGALFVPRCNRALYCDKCASEEKRRRIRERVLRHRAGR